MFAVGSRLAFTRADEVTVRYAIQITNLDSGVDIEIESRRAAVRAAAMEEHVQLGDVLQLGVAVEQQRRVVRRR
jgi:hypothetical protein